MVPLREMFYLGTLGRTLSNRISVILVNKKKCGLINTKYIGKMQKLTRTFNNVPLKNTTYNSYTFLMYA